jgi:hypothetical protein
MSRVKTIQNSMNTGIISPRMLGRIDFDKYYSAVEEAENVVCLPHGGMQRRAGLLSIVAVAVGSRLFSFEFSVTQNYVLVFSNYDIKIYKPGDKTLYATITYATEGLSNITNTQRDEMDIIQSADTVIFTHGDFPPRSLQRQGSDSSWSLDEIEFRNIPQYDFSVTPTLYYYGGVIEIDVEVNDIVYYAPGGDNSLGTSGYYYKALQNQVAVDLSTEDFGNYVNWDNLGKRQSVWGETDYPYDLLNPLSAAISKGDICKFDWAANLMRARVDTPVVGIDPDQWEDLATADTTDRGWVSTCTFHQGRLWFGGSKTKPTYVWGSVVNEPFNFDTGKDNVLADHAIFDILDTDQFNAIVNIISGTKLEVLTTGGEFINTADVITPATSAWTRYTGYGAKRLKPATLDGATYYADRFSKAVRSMLYSYDENGYISIPVSLLADHLFNDISDMDILRGSTESVSNLLYVVNGDGTVAVFNTMRKENLNGWTKWTTQGYFKRVTVSGDTVSFVVARGGAEYLEVLDNSVLLDHAFTATSDNKVEVDIVLYTNDLKVVADDVTQTETSAVEEGGIYYAYADRDGDTLYSGLSYGAEYDTKIKTLPVAIQTQSEGNLVHATKRIVRCILDLFESRGVYVNGNLITHRTFGYPTDLVYPLITGQRSTYMLGYNKKSQIEITQNNPNPMTVLSIDLEVSF